jgi:hypothetical protein
MASNAASITPPNNEDVLRDCVEALRRVANYRLPRALDRRLLWLSENQEQLDDEERDELLGLVEMADQRGLDKVQAKAVLQQLASLYPGLTSSRP